MLPTPLLLVALAGMSTVVTVGVVMATPTPSPPPAPVAASSKPASATTTPPTSTLSSSETGQVQRVIDGDTVVLADKRRVRLLGIDSCEMSTPAGATAKAAMEALAAGKQVELRAEPGVDLDRNDRLLRYVTLPDGRDAGEAMVPASHTGIYRTGGDASRAYVDRLRALDGTWDCGEPTATRSLAGGVERTQKAAPSSSKPLPTRATPKPSGGSFKNCSEVRAAGRAPIRVGEPGFSSKFDANHDGVGCE